MAINHDETINEEYSPKHAYGYIDRENEDNTSEDAVEDFFDINEVRKSQDKKKKINYRKRRKKRRVKKWILNVFVLFFLATTGLSVYKIFIWNDDNKDTSEIVDEINKDVVISEIEDDDDTELIGEPDKQSEALNDYWYYIKFPLIDVDIDSLKEKNNDTVGWINVNNTNINYPFVQSNDNKFYLDHSFDKSYNEAGWVFLDYRNDSDLNNKNTILYAHSRLDKTMFGSLSRVLKNDWYQNKDNHIIRISTDKYNTLWQIFSVYKIKEETYYITTNFNSDSEYTLFLDTLKERSLYNFNTNLSSEDKILTLSTCYSDMERTVVHAKLIKRNIKE